MDMSEMKKIRAAIVGYGNIGRYTLEALRAANDFEIAGVVRRNGARTNLKNWLNYEVVKNIRDLKALMLPFLQCLLAVVQNMQKTSLA